MLYIARMYVKLARLHSSVLLGVAPVCGAIAMGKELSFMHYFILFVIGLFVHIYWFVLNEYADIEVDRKSKDLAGKPLVSGAISPNSALAFLLCALACSFLLLFLFPIERIPYMALFLSATVFSGGIYDIYGKRIAIADYVLAFVPSMLCLTGAFSVGSSLTPLALGISAIAYIQGLGQNVAAGLKDVDHDYLAGAKTTPLRLGVKVIDGMFIVPIGFTAYMILITLFKGLAVFLPFYYGTKYSDIQIIFIILALIATSSIALKFCTMKNFERDRLIRMIGVHEIFTWSLAPLMLLNLIGPLNAFLLFVFPIVWLFIFLRIQYGSFKPEI